MPGKQYTGGSGIYLSIVGGKLRQKVDEGTEGAVLRKYETPTGVKGEKWELVYESWSGVVKGLRINENDYGKFLEVKFDDATLSIHTDSRYFGDFCKKLASCDITREITVRPYDFEDDNKNKVTGVTLTQKGNGWKDDKAVDYFYDFVAKKQLHDFPKSGHTKAKPYDKDDWKIYFLEVKKFLEAYIMLNIEPKIVKESEPEEESAEDAVNIDIPSGFDAEKELAQVKF